MKVLLIIAALLLIIIICLAIPQSPLKKKFVAEVANELSNCRFTDEVFTEEEMVNLPLPVQRYFRTCGLIGKPKMANCQVLYKDVDFKMGPDKPVMKIEYQQYNFTAEPTRIVYIGARMYGIPFEGRDKFQQGKGAMTAVLAKIINLFNVNGSEMDQSALLTYLAECLLIPNAALQDYITWEAVDNYQAKATITKDGIKASGVFTFNEQGEMIRFETGDRYMDLGQGKFAKVKWTCEADDYIVEDGIKHPSVLKAFWHLPEGDFVYFDSSGISVAYDVRQVK